MPEACALVPGAWLAIRSVAVGDAWKTGRGLSGNTSAHARHERTSSIKDLNEAALTQAATASSWTWTLSPQWVLRMTMDRAS